MDALMFNRGAAAFSANSKGRPTAVWLGLATYDVTSTVGGEGSRVWQSPFKHGAPPAQKWPDREARCQRWETAATNVLNEIWRDCSIFKRVGAVTRFHFKPCSSLTSLTLWVYCFSPKVISEGLYSVWDVSQLTTKIYKIQRNHVCLQTNASYLVPQGSIQSSNRASGSQVRVRRHISLHFEHEHKLTSII